MDPRERQALRSRLLGEIYRATNGERWTRVLPADFAHDVDPAERDGAFRWLADNGYLEAVSMAGDYMLTPAGLNAAEEAYMRSLATPPPSMPGEEDPFDGDGLHVVVLSKDAVAAIEALLGHIDRLDIPSKLEGDALHSFEADRTSVAAQISSPTPRKRTVRDGLRNMLRAIRALGVEISAEIAVKALKLD